LPAAESISFCRLKILLGKLSELLALNDHNRGTSWRGHVRAGVQSFTAAWGKVKSRGRQITLNTRIARFSTRKELLMNNIIYIVGLVVVIIAVLSFFGLR
jgi:small-conductance mechanosensitive channel